MVGTLTSIYRGEESLPIQEICALHRGRPARARWGQNNRCIAQLAENFREGTQVIAIVPWIQENIGQFLAARQLLGHPIAIYVWAGPEEDE